MMPRHQAPLVYLAARYSRRDELNGYAAQLRELGLGRVDARWLTGSHDWQGAQDTVPELVEAQQFALDDVGDLERAHVVVVFSEPVRDVRALVLDELDTFNPMHSDPVAVAERVAEQMGRNRGGRHVEYGLAIGLGKHVVVVGPAEENVFHTLPNVMRVADWTSALAHLVQWKDTMEAAAVRQRLLQMNDHVRRVAVAACCAVIGLAIGSLLAAVLT